MSVSHVVIFSAGSSHSLEETEAAGRETGKNNSYLPFLPHTVPEAEAVTSKPEHRGQLREGGMSVFWGSCLV